MGQPVRALKKSLRKEMSNLLNQIPPEKIEEEKNMEMVKLESLDDYLSLKLNKWVALALDSQILKDKDIPVTNNDQKPDFIISPYQDIDIQISIDEMLPVTGVDQKPDLILSP
ncbi:2130_t:CDS:2, partial [Racocetra fulgida]